MKIGAHLNGLCVRLQRVKGGFNALRVIVAYENFFIWGVKILNFDMQDARKNRLV